MTLGIVARGELDAESEGERWLSTIFLPTDPWPLWQVWVLDDVRVDALYPEARLALEYDGRKYHSIDVDRQRDLAPFRAVWRARLRPRSSRCGTTTSMIHLRCGRASVVPRRIRQGVPPLRDFHPAQR